MGTKLGPAPFLKVEGVVPENRPLGVAYMDVGEVREQERKLCNSLLWSHQTTLIAPKLGGFG